MCGENANVIASIKKRVVNSDLIVDNKIDFEKLNPVIFLGDEYKKIYRYLTKNSDESGKFFKKEF